MDTRTDDVELSLTDRMRFRWMLCLAGFEPQDSQTFHHISPTGREYIVHIPDRGSLAVITFWTHGSKVWFGKFKNTPVREFWTNWYRPVDAVPFDEDDFMNAAYAALDWVNEEPPAAMEEV